MKMCSAHFEDLAAALKRKGMWGLVNTDPEASKASAMRWLHGKMRPQDFDPLIGSTLEIYGKASEMLDGRMSACQCPLCEVSRRAGRDLAGPWIDNCTDLMLTVCLTNGLSTAKH